MDVSKVMTRDVEVVGPDATLQEAAQKMKAIDVGSLPVCDGRKLQGMLTDRDVAIRAVAEGRDPRQTKVREVMTADIVYGRTGQDIKEIAETMAAHQIRRLPIVNEDNELVGIVALGDIAVDVADESLTGDVLADVSSPSKPKRKKQQ
jgi:CBS domain-containing protein